MACPLNILHADTCLEDGIDCMEGIMTRERPCLVCGHELSLNGKEEKKSSNYEYLPE